MLADFALRNTAFKLSKLTPRTSFPALNSEKLSLGIRKFTIATFAGSIATIDIPESLILIFTSLTISEIIAITSENAFGLSNFALMFIDSQDTFKLYCSELTKGI